MSEPTFSDQTKSPQRRKSGFLGVIFYKVIFIISNSLFLCPNFGSVESSFFFSFSIILLGLDVWLANLPNSPLLNGFLFEH